MEISTCIVGCSTKLFVVSSYAFSSLVCALKELFVVSSYSFSSLVCALKELFVVSSYSFSSLVCGLKQDPNIQMVKDHNSFNVTVQNMCLP